MKISSEEIKKLASNIKLDITDDEVLQLQDSIEEITTSLDEMLEIQTSDECKIMGNENIYNVFNEDVDSEIDVKDIHQSLNNFDGTYITVNKVEQEDE